MGIEERPVIKYCIDLILSSPTATATASQLIAGAPFFPLPRTLLSHRRGNLTTSLVHLHHSILYPK